MLLSYTELLELVQQGVLTDTPLGNINGSSIDLNLGNEILVEGVPDPVCPACQDTSPNHHVNLRNLEADVFCRSCKHTNPTWMWIPKVDPSKKENLLLNSVDISEQPYVLMPGHTCLAHTQQVFNLPSDISAEYKLKSSHARTFLDHLNAGWADAGWHGSVLTLEFVNHNRYHAITLTAGSKCGQMCFFKHTPVPVDKSYAVRGQYNKDSSVSASKGAK